MARNTVEFFITKVRNSPCLWNLSHVSYRDLARKDMAWERVARECGLSNGKEAKLQWKKLRDSHREALRRRKPSSGPSAQQLKPWKYEENMRFVAPKSDLQEYSMYCIDSNDDESYNDATENIPIELPVPEPVLQNTDPLFTNDEEQKQRDRHEMRMQMFDMNRCDGLSKLFDSLCQKTRELPKYLQLRVQREIFDSVSRAEEEALSLNPELMNGYSVSSPSSSRTYNSATIDHEYETKFSHKSVDG